MSAIRPLHVGINVTSLVVCLPRPKASLTSPVFKFRFLSILFKRVLFPAPVCPPKALTEFLSSFLIFLISVFLYTL